MDVCVTPPAAVHSTAAPSFPVRPIAVLWSLLTSFPLTALQAGSLAIDVI